MIKTPQTLIARIEIDGQTAARINAAGDVEVIDDSSRLQEILSMYYKASKRPSVHGLHPVVATCLGLSDGVPEVKLSVHSKDWLIGDMVGG